MNDKKIQACHIHKQFTFNYIKEFVAQLNDSTDNWSKIFSINDLKQQTTFLSILLLSNYITTNQRLTTFKANNIHKTLHTTFSKNLSSDKS